MKPSLPRRLCAVLLPALLVVLAVPAVASAQVALPRRPAPAALTAPGEAPVARSGHCAIIDPVRDRMIVFGGRHLDTHFDDVWALSLTGTPAWTLLTPDGAAPVGRRFASAIYDPVRDRMVVFGGYTGELYLDEVWALSLGGTPTWTQLAPTGNGTGPDARYRHGAIYDPVRDRMIVFGGWQSGTNYNDVWAMSLGDQPAWTELAPEGELPKARYSQSVVYDPVRDRMLVFGGVQDGFFDDTWALSLSGPPAWSELTPEGLLPNARYVHSAVYDPSGDRMVVFGGYDGEAYRDDVWALTLSGTPAWTELGPTGTLPSGRFSHSAVYDAPRDRMIVFGGTDDPDLFGDTWELGLGEAPGWTGLLQPDRCALTVAAQHGTVTLEPPAVDGVFPNGTAVRLTATPDADHHFTGFSGDASSAYDTLTVIVTSDMTVVAGFVADSVVLTVNTANGSVVETPAAISGRYPYGAAVLLTATPSAGYHFVEFSGDVTAATDTVTVIMTGDRSVTAEFLPTAGIDGGARPAASVLLPAMPNPFRQSATLAYAIARGGAVRLTVYAVDGRVVRTLVDGSREPGEHRASWDGRDDAGRPVPAGVYYARLEAADRTQSRVVLRLR